MQIQAEETKDLEKQSQESRDIIQRAREKQVKNDMDLHESAEILKIMKAFIDGVKLYWKPLKDQAFQVHRSLCKKESDIVDPVQTEYDALKKRAGNYQLELQRKEQEARDKAEREAREKEAQKQRDIQAKIDAENKRIREEQEAEDRRRREEQRRIQAEKDKEKKAQLEREENARREAEERRLAEERERAQQKTEVLEEKKADVYVAPKAVAAATQAKGMTARFKYKVLRVTDISKIPVEYLQLNTARAEKFKNEMGDDFVIPGIEFSKEPIVSVRSK